MTELDPVEVTRRYLEATASEDLARWVADDEVDREVRSRAAAFIDPDVEIVDSAGLVGLGVRSRGRGWDFLRGNYAELTAVFESYSERAEELRDLGGGRVLVLGEARGTPRGGGPDVVQLGGVIVTVAGGKIVRLEYFLDRAEALAAAQALASESARPGANGTVAADS